MSNALTKVCHSILSAPLAFLLLCNVTYAQRSEEPQTGIYHIDPGQSEIRILVYRGGLLSTFGHNHVVSVGDFKGAIQLRPTLTNSTVELEVPVTGLIVDGAAARLEEGNNFASQPSKSDIAQTRANMLGNRLLDAKQHPMIKIQGIAGPVTGNSANLNLTVELLGKKFKLSVPSTFKLEGYALEASGTTRLSHKQLGLQPFSALMGALKVAEDMDFKYRIRAHRVEK